ncbi:FGGY-family carbohydrate kinase [Lactobacillus johnsonii]|uniref:FGGY-family carbohydrate kinase n=2 Tax=Lactobacillus TaxID=1578 RepID=UPI0037BFB410
MLNIGNNLPKNINNQLNTSFAWSINGQKSYVYEGNINYAGAAITWLKDKIHLIDDPNATADLALTANPNDRTILIPAFAGLGAPYWLPNMKAAFVNMTATTGKKELVRATLNSLVYQINDILETFHHLSSQVNDEIHTDGGMIKNKYLMQYLSNITQKDVKIANISELSALGSAMNAMQHFDGLKNYSKTYIPRITKNIATNYSKEWSSWIKKIS